ncbi:hypothetical protein GCM10020295_13640 [Streptomyces cinereospinus]
MLRSIGYTGPVSVEWEDAGMDRLQGAPRGPDPPEGLRLRAAERVLRRRVQQLTHLPGGRPRTGTGSTAGPLSDLPGSCFVL